MNSLASFLDRIGSRLAIAGGACLVLALAAARGVATAPEVPAAPNTLTEAERSDGWLLLFDGASRFGWEAGSKADWTVADGTIKVSGGQGGLLCTTSEFADFELALDFRAPTDTNSGVFLRTPLVPHNPAKDCYEVNIDSAAGEPFPTGSLVGRKRGPIDGVDDQWHHYDITVEGSKFHVELDSRPVLEYDDPHPLLRGRIALQSNHGPVAFRNIKLKPLGLRSIFNGRDLTGWTVFPGKPTRVSVTAAADRKQGSLRMIGGPGQVETTGRYGDFMLQLEAFVGRGTNSGVFFRCIPGDFQMGYECQIQNSFVGDDRARPKDCGTGGIYRRQNARRVVSDDLAWFPMTVLAERNHVATWVGGLQVCDFTDLRKKNPNPRRGLRLEAGTIILQAHDASTDVTFRNMRIVALPAAKPEPAAPHP